MCCGRTAGRRSRRWATGSWPRSRRRHGAVECAIALQRAFEELHHGPGADSGKEPIHIRIGLNAGEPIEEGGDLFGATVIMASRIAAHAKGSEILASDVVRGLCSGKGFLFADRGENVLRGFEDAVRLYEVSWRSRRPPGGSQPSAVHTPRPHQIPSRGVPDGGEPPASRSE